MKKKKQKKQQKSEEDPFFGLKYIAYCRSKMPPSEAGVEDENLVDYARHQICKVKNILFNDPVWGFYTPEEVLIEFFAIKFDENEGEADAFLKELKGGVQSDLEWFERMEKKYVAEKEKEIKEQMGGKDEIEDTF